MIWNRRQFLVSSMFIADVLPHHFKLFGDKSKELIIYSIPGCVPCLKLKKIFQESQDELTKSGWIWKYEADTQDENIKSFPTVMAYDKKGNKCGEFKGLKTKEEFLDWLNNVDKYTKD